MQSANTLPIRQDPFALLYHNYSRLVASIAANFPLTPQQREEVCQDVFVIVWQRQEQLQHEHAFASWLGTITRHRCLNELRRKKPTIPLEDVTEEVIHAHQEASIQPREDAWQWHLEVSIGLLHRLIEDHRSPMRRRVAQLFYVDALSVVAISEQLNICPNTVLSHLRRFRLIVEKSLMRLADEEGFDLASA